MSLNLAMMLALVAVSAVTDIRKRLIYDALTFPAMLAGLYLGLMAGPESLALSLAGLVAGLLVLYPFYRVGGMGFGDLKLLGAVGALGGLPVLVSAAVDTALAGGIMAVFLIIRQGSASEIMGRSPAVLRAIFSRNGAISPSRHSRRETIPYGVAIFFGTVIAWLTRWPW